YGRGTAATVNGSFGLLFVPSLSSRALRTGSRFRQAATAVEKRNRELCTTWTRVPERASGARWTTAISLLGFRATSIVRPRTSMPSAFFGPKLSPRRRHHLADLLRRDVDAPERGQRPPAGRPS